MTALRAAVLDGLHLAADTLRDGHRECEDCRRRGGACPDRQRDLTEASLYEGTAAIIRRVTSDNWQALLRGQPATTTNRGNPA